MAKPLLIATNLDGSLLDANTHGYEAARPALAAVARNGVMLVLASSKTRAELVRLARALRLPVPLIIENGGALLIPRGLLACRAPGSRLSGGYEVLALGLARQRLVAALAGIVAETGACLRAFSALAPGEIERITGLSCAAARLARERSWDEPFLADAADAARVSAAARRRGLRVTRGGRFYHLTGANDKGLALGLLLDLLAAEGRSYATVGLGDSANDLPMLERVERPILVPRLGGAVDSVLAAGLPRAERASAPGPIGWNAAVLAVLAGVRLQPVAHRQPGRRAC
jgi:mannosyl-3-phosphoglycerate phosphatase